MKNGLKSMKYYKFGHGKWINENSGEELLKAMVDYRLRQMMGIFYDLAPKYTVERAILRRLKSKKVDN